MSSEVAVVLLAQARRRYECLALHLVEGEPLLVHAVRALRKHPKLRHAPTIVVVPAEIVGEVAALGKDIFADPPLTVIGTRAASLDAALHDAITALDGDPSRSVLVHDLRRAFVSQDLVERVLEATTDRGTVPVAYLVDTVKEVDASGRVMRTLARETLAHVQTPQTASLAQLRTVHESCPPGGDATLLGLVGFDAAISRVPGDASAALVAESAVGFTDA